MASLRACNGVAAHTTGAGHGVQSPAAAPAPRLPARRTPRAPRPWPPSRPGFTLVELLVAVTLMGLIAVLIFAGFRTGTRAWDAGDAVSERSNEMRLVHGLLRRRLSAALLLLAREDGKWKLQFDGERERLRFVIESSPRFGIDGFHALQVELSGHGRKRDLTLASALLGADTDRGEGAEIASRSVLLENPKSVELDYFGASGPLAPDWHSHWDSTDALPRLVRLRVTPARGDAWPALIVRLHSAGKRLLGGQGASPEDAAPGAQRLLPPAAGASPGTGTPAGAPAPGPE